MLIKGEISCLRPFWIFIIFKYECHICYLVISEIALCQIYFLTRFLIPIPTCFLSKSLDSNLFYVYHPLHSSQLLQIELRCSEGCRKNEEQQISHSCLCTSYCHEIPVLLWGSTAELGWAKLFLMELSFLVESWHLFHCLSLTNNWAFLFSHKCLPVLCVVANLGIILYYILL